MFKKFFAAFFLFFLCLSLFSQENSETLTESPNPGRFTLGAGLGYGPKLDMNANFEFGFLLFHNNKWDIRNHVLVNSYFVVDNEKIENTTQNLTDKISFGWVHNSGIFRPYSYIEGGIGFYSNDSKKYWTMPLTYSVGFGIGLEVFPWKNMSFFVEPGLMWQFMGNKNFLVQKVTIGIKYYIK
jgi:hypothetical protein